MWPGAIPVRIRSTNTADNCVRRLLAVTSSRSRGRFLDGRTAGRPEPLFRGHVGASGLEVARFSETLGRNSFYAVLAAEIRPLNDGGSELEGAAGLAKGVRLLIPVLLIVGGLMLLAFFGAGVSSLASGHVGSSLPFLLIPVGLGAFGGGLISTGVRSSRTDTAKLVEEVRDVLDGEVEKS